MENSESNTLILPDETTSHPEELIYFLCDGKEVKIKMNICLTSNSCQHYVEYDNKHFLMRGDQIYGLFMYLKMPVQSHFQYCKDFYGKNKMLEIIESEGGIEENDEKELFEMTNVNIKYLILKKAVRKCRYVMIDFLVKKCQLEINYECFLSCLEIEDEIEALNMFSYLFNKSNFNVQKQSKTVYLGKGGNNLLASAVYYRQIPIIKFMFDNLNFKLNCSISEFNTKRSVPLTQLVFQKQIESKKSQTLKVNSPEELLIKFPEEMEKIEEEVLILGNQKINISSIKPGIYFQKSKYVYVKTIEHDIEIANFLLKKSVEEQFIYTNDISYLKRIKCNIEGHEFAYDFLKKHNLIVSNEVETKVNIYNDVYPSFDEYVKYIEKTDNLRESDKNLCIEKMAMLNTLNNAKINMEQELKCLNTFSREYSFELPRNIFNSRLKKIDIKIRSKEENLHLNTWLDMNGLKIPFSNTVIKNDYLFSFSSHDPIPYKEAEFTQTRVVISNLIEIEFSIEDFNIDITYNYGNTMDAINNITRFVVNDEITLLCYQGSICRI